MKRIIILLLVFNSLNAFCQTGFKIKNSKPVINTSTDTTLIEKKSKGKQKKYLYELNYSDKIKYNYLIQERKPLDSILKALKDSLLINSQKPAKYHFTLKQRKTINDSIESYKVKIAENKKSVDSILGVQPKKENVYKTVEIIDYNYLSGDKEPKENELLKLKNELYQNSLGSLDARFSEEEIKKKKARIKQLSKEIDTINKQQDSLYHIYTKDYLHYKNWSYFSFGPKRSKAFFDIVYGNTGKRFRLLNNTGFNIGNNSGSIYSEIASGNLGIIRVSLGAMVSSSSSDSLEVAKKEEAYQRLITSGGNTVLKIEYPLAYIHSSNNQYNFISRAVVKGTADFPEFGTTTDKWAGSGSFGLDLYADAALDNNSLRFFVNYNINQVYGTSTFIENLDVTKSHFSFGQLTLGLVVLENVKLSFIVKTWSSESSLKNANVVAGGQFLH